MKFKANAEIFLKKTLGEETLQELNKFELVKEKTQTTVDHEEINTALQIVPRTILSFLKKELSSMKEKDGKEIEIPIEPKAFLSITKYTNDVYSGEIHRNGDILARFKYRSLPGVGLVIMTTFEMYDVENIEKIPDTKPNSDIINIQQIIDERLNLHSLVRQVVDQKISEKQALEAMVKLKIEQLEQQKSMPEAETKPIADKVQEVIKQNKLKNFLDKTKSKKNAPNEFKIEMLKSEQVSCPDCKQSIFDGTGVSACICFGEDYNKKIFIKKTETGISIRFPKSWDTENIEMLLEILRKRNGSKHE